MASSFRDLGMRLARQLRRALSVRFRRHALAGPAHLWRLKRDFQIAFLKSVGLEPRHTVLDLGCGTLRGGLPLIEYLDAKNYCGVEARADALAEGRAELEAAGLADRDPDLCVESDFAAFRQQRRFDFVWAFSVTMHLSDEIFLEFLRCGRAHLAPAGAFYANALIGEAPPGSWRGFPVIARSLDQVRDAATAAGLQTEDLGPLSELGHVSGIEVQDAQRMFKWTPLP